MAKNADRELRDLLESTQAEVKRLKAELTARESTGYETAQRELEKELQALRARAQALEKENAALRKGREAAASERLAALKAELSHVRQEASQASDEAKQLKKRLEATTRELEKSRAKVQRLSNLPSRDSSSLRDRVAAFFSRSTRTELERAQKEITRLNQQLSLVQVPRRRGR
ncbi:hypothetical protein [Hyalangium rubrum]|uniref:Uncharacterized protein n=1 Tax=Hyalangium rubrum TaxID=3103134 RepID=A0ABU5HBF5_9BACT|nr:hypothetical protein [Hyalangium sp. s54d21]MDY7230808.1 hypothetical protein [Hyalangium sp. s54d21]